MQQTMTALLSCAVILAAVDKAFPQEMESDRPDNTESAVTVTPRSIQFEGGYTFTWDPDITEHSLGELLIRWGLLDWMELRFGLNSFLWTVQNNETFYGKDDMSFGLKFQIFRSPEEGFPVPDIAFIVTGIFPTGSGRYREPLVQVLGKLCAAWQLGEFFDFGINAGYAYASVDRERYHQASFSSVLGWLYSERVRFFIEYFGLYPESAGEQNAHYADLGFTYRVLDNFQLDIRGGIRLDSREYFLGAGFVGRWMY